MEQHSAMSEDKDIFELECEVAKQREQLKLLAMQNEMLQAKVIYNAETIKTIDAMKEYKKAVEITVHCRSVFALLDLLSAVSCSTKICDSKPRQRLYGAIFKQSESNAQIDKVSLRNSSRQNYFCDEELFSLKSVDDGVEIEGYASEKLIDTLYVPDTIKGKSVIGIGEKAFSGMGIELIRLPQTIKYIGKDAFYGCKSLEVVNLPDQIESLGEEAFYDCENLQCVAIPRKVKCISKSCFRNCKNLSKVVLNDGLEIIESYAFDNTPLRKIVIPDSVKLIEKYAFRKYHRNKDVSNIPLVRPLEMAFAVPNSDNIVIETDGLGDNPIIYCIPQSYIWRVSKASGCVVKNLAEFIDGNIKFDKKYELEEITNNKLEIERLQLQNLEFQEKLNKDEEILRTINSVEHGNELDMYVPYRKRKYEIDNLSNAVIYATVIEESNQIQKLLHTKRGPENEKGKKIVTTAVTIDRNNLYSKEETLYSVTALEDGVEIVRYNGIVDFGTLRIPDMISEKAVVSIGIYAFRNLKFEAIQIPDTVRYIKYGAFFCCSQLSYIKLPTGLKSLDESSFMRCRNLRCVVIPVQIKKIPRGCFRWCSKLSQLILNDGLEEIGSKAFNYSAIDSVIFPSSLRTIREGAFGNSSYYNEIRNASEMSFAFLGIDDVEIEPESIPMSATIYCWPKSKVWETALNMGYTTKPLTECAIHE